MWCNGMAKIYGWSFNISYKSSFHSTISIVSQLYDTIYLGKHYYYFECTKMMIKQLKALREKEKTKIQKSQCFILPIQYHSNLSVNWIDHLKCISSFSNWMKNSHYQNTHHHQNIKLCVGVSGVSGVNGCILFNLMFVSFSNLKSQTMKWMGE